MPVKLNGATSGGVTLDVPAVAGTNTLTLPARTGTVITSADSATVTQAMLAGNVAGNGPSFSINLSSAQTVSNSVATKAQLNSEEFDFGGCYNNTASTATLNGLSVPAYAFMPNVAGYYQINGSVNMTASTSATVGYVALNKNGTEYKRGQQLNFVSGNCNVFGAAISTIVYLNGSTDYVELAGYIGGSGTLQFASAWMNGYLARSA